MQVTGNSDLTLDKALGNTVSSLAVDQGSTLGLTKTREPPWTSPTTAPSAFPATSPSNPQTPEPEPTRWKEARWSLAGQTSLRENIHLRGNTGQHRRTGTKSVSVSGITGDINMGGLDGGKLDSISMGTGTGTISGLTGNADLSGSLTQLRLSAANMGAEGTGIIRFNDAAGSSLTLGELTLTLTADAVALLNAPGDYAFHITNAALHADPNNITLSEYNGMAWDITRTENGRVIISFGHLDAHDH